MFFFETGSLMRPRLVTNSSCNEPIMQHHTVLSWLFSLCCYKSHLFYPWHPGFTMPSIWIPSYYEISTSCLVFPLPYGKPTKENLGTWKIELSHCPRNFSNRSFIFLFCWLIDKHLRLTWHNCCGLELTLVVNGEENKDAKAQERPAQFAIAVVKGGWVCAIYVQTTVESYIQVHSMVEKPSLNQNEYLSR